jgi:cobalt-zinc-cadmium efflux system protein
VRSDPRRLFLALGICAAATAAELCGGALTRSLALTADGLHSLLHVGALVIALWGARSGERRAAGLNAGLIVVLAGGLAVESTTRFIAPVAVAYGPALVVTGFGLAANLATAMALGWGRPEDLNHRAALLHMLGDAAVAVLALVGLSLGWAFHWAGADPAAGLGGALLLAAIGARLAQRTLGPVSPAPSYRS